MSVPIVAAAMKSAFTFVSTNASLIGAGLSAGSTAVTYAGAKSQADATEASNREANERARKYMIEDQDALTLMGKQETAAATQKINANAIEGAKTRATAQASASAGGVSGLSIDALLGDIFGQEASIRDSVNQNLEATGQQIGKERQSVTRGFENTINSRPQANQPSLLGAGLTAGTGIMGAYKDDFKIRAQTYNKG